MRSLLSFLARGVDAVVARLDELQRHASVLSFLFAVDKKYNDDEAGNKAALVAYYGFLSLFPLLLVLTSIVTFIAQYNPVICERIASGAVVYFPIVGRDLQHSIHGLHKSGLAFIIGILLMLFGARGIADAFRNSVDHIWQFPYTRRSTFPTSMIKSLGIIIVGGFGAALAPLISSIALAFGHGVVLRLITVLISSVVLFWTIIFMVKVGSSMPRRFRDIAVGAVIATVCLEALQSVGDFLMARELQRLDTLYGTFAIVLGLMFWIYLQAQVLLYALEIDVVRAMRLWPRSLRGPLTPADERAYQLYSRRTIYHEVNDAAAKD